MEPVPRISNRANLKHILQMTKAEKLEFINSFDLIISDCDATLWWYRKQIPGVPETIKLLESNGKRLRYVSNNSFITKDSYREKFAGIGVRIKEEDLVYPVLALIQYLEEIKFKGVIYCIGTKIFKDYLRNAGFEILDGPAELMEDNLPAMIRTVHDQKKINAVVIDVDFNLSYAKLLRAEFYVKLQPDCLFIKGLTDKKISVTPELSFMGPGYFVENLERAAGREAIVISKPGKALAGIILKRFEITEPARVLFIGDMLEQDMAFGTQCGFQKLLVLTGGSTEEELLSESLPEEQIPDYYADSFADFIRVFQDIN